MPRARSDGSAKPVRRHHGRPYGGHLPPDGNGLLLPYRSTRSTDPGGMIPRGNVPETIVHGPLRDAPPAGLILVALEVPFGYELY